MKTSHIIGIIVIAVAIGIIVSTAGDASAYVTFAEAKAMSIAGKDKKIHVVGTLKKNALEEVIGIQESPDKLSFSFIMVDQNNEESTVLYANPIPQDFTRSEQVVIVGNYYNEAFIAEKILLKCPSKYQENEIKS